MARYARPAPLMPGVSGINMSEIFIKNRKLFYASLACALLPFIYMIFLSNDPRFIDQTLTSEEMYWWEFLLLYAGVISIFTVYFSSIKHAW